MEIINQNIHKSIPKHKKIMGQFKAVEGMPGIEVDHKGNVRQKSVTVGDRTIRNVRLIPGRELLSGFLYVLIGGKRHKVHRLVAMVHVPNPDGFRFVVFKDGDRTNVKAKNLEWVRSVPRKRWGLKIDPREIEDIRKALAKGVKGYKIARKYNVTPGLISRIKAGTRWK